MSLGEKRKRKKKDPVRILNKDNNNNNKGGKRCTSMHISFSSALLKKKKNLFFLEHDSVHDSEQAYYINTANDTCLLSFLYKHSRYVLRTEILVTHTSASSVLCMANYTGSEQASLHPSFKFCQNCSATFFWLFFKLSFQVSFVGAQMQ